MSSLLRSTKFVRYFTGAARTILLNSAKTAETNLLINSKALCAANNVLMRDYATKKAESLEPLLLKLDSEVRRYGRITKKDIDDVFDEIRSRNDITSSQSLLVIRCCGELVPEELPEQRTLLVQKIWSVLTERGIPMDISHYNALLRVYLENEHPFSPAQFLEELEKKGLQPNRVTYQRLMWRYCQDGDVEGATKVLEKMRELNFPVSEPVLNALVMGHAFHGDTDGAKAVIETMARAGLQPTNRTYTLLACGFARKGDVDGINEVIKQAHEKEAIIIDKDVLEIIENLTISGHSDKIERLFPHLKKSVGYNQDVCNLILKLLNKGYLDIAKKMLTTMPNNTQQDTMFKGAFFIKQLIRVGKTPDEVVKTCLELKREELIPNSIYMATEQALIQGRTELAEKLFIELEKEGQEIRPHYYWPLLAQKVKENDEEGLIQLIKNMYQKNINLSGEALRDYVIPYLMKKDPKTVVTKLQLANVPIIHTARNLIIELLDGGKISEAADIALQYKPRGNFGLLRNPLLNALAKTKDIKSFVNILHVMSSRPQNSQVEEDNDDGQQYDTDLNESSRIIQAAVKIVSRNNMALPLLKLLHSKGLRITTQSAETIEQYLGENMTTEISELLSKLTSAELEAVPLEASKRDTPRTSVELEKLLEVLNNREGTNIKWLQKQLLTCYIRESNVDKVNSYLEELKSSGFEINVQTYAQLFEFYCDNSQIEKAKECHAQILAKDPEFVLNPFKIIAMTSALIKANQFDEAIKFLQDSKLEEPDTSFLYNSKCWQLLNSVVEQKDPAKVKQMTNTLIEMNFIKPSNVLLGPLIKVHMLNNDLEGALNEFEYCCKQYRSTPWKGELMKALIMKEDAVKLQWLADLSTQIHGEVNVLHDLVLAFVECGRLRQARRILGTPGLQTRHRRLEEACLRYVEEGKSEYLEGLLEATKELSHIDRSNIFYHLLVTYCKADETDKALGLWTLLQEEGEVPSEQFLSYLGNHLKSKKRPVPFVIPNVNQNVEIKRVTERREVKVQPAEQKVARKIPSDTAKSHISSEIETLILNGELSKAVETTIKSVNNGQIPRTNILKYLLKTLALQGNVESIEKIGKLLNDGLKTKVRYDDKLILAKFEKGGADKHIDELVKSMNGVTSDKDLQDIVQKFPKNQALSSVVNNDELLAKCVSVADYAVSKGYFNLMNLVWMELLLSGKIDKADELWNQHLVKSPVIVFRRLLQESFIRKQPELIEKLIETLKTNKLISTNSLGNAYSRLIGYYVAENQIDKAEQTLEVALKNGITTEQINKSCLYKLKSQMEASGKDFKYKLN